MFTFQTCLTEKSVEANFIRQKRHEKDPNRHGEVKNVLSVGREIYLEQTDDAK